MRTRTSRATCSRSRRRSARVVRLLQPLEAGRARPLAVDGQEPAAGEPQRVLDDRAPEGRVRFQQVGRELAERPREDVLARGAAAAGAGHDHLEPPEAVRRAVELRAARLLDRLHLGQHALRRRQAALQVLGRAREADERGLAPLLHLEAHLLLRAGHAVEHLLEALRAPATARRGEHVADEGAERERGEDEDGGERVHAVPACHEDRPGRVRARGEWSWPRGLL